MEITGGKLYLFIERVPLRTHLILRKELANGRKVLYVSKNPPVVLENQLSSEDGSLQLKWLSPRTDKNCISPMNLTMIEDEICKFMESHKDGIIVINGLEVLEMWNGFMPMVKMVERIKEKLVDPEKAILISLDPKNLVSNNLNRLERVTDVVVAPG
ncbi:MAG: hypothetical protein A4E32_00895 [Methanomassiliicoccales archaeon PtaU1.Bin124]|nr:MAG: hypothetical protein A4E32_00895 [Methanomassiliicoccales archaeon PtaU1.Bin124]